MDNHVDLVLFGMTDIGEYDPILTIAVFARASRIGSAEYDTPLGAACAKYAAEDLFENHMPQLINDFVDGDRRHITIPYLVFYSTDDQDPTPLVTEIQQISDDAIASMICAAIRKECH